MLLAIDIGNSKIAFGLFDEDKIIHHLYYASDEWYLDPCFIAPLKRLFKETGISPGDIKNAVIASVVQKITPALERSLMRSGKIENVLVITHDTPSGLVNGYEKPEELGLDRLANAAGGVLMAGAPIIVADIGTAITLEAVDHDRVFRGGVIMPGIDMAADCLYYRTSQLPRSVPRIFPEKAIGRNTLSCMQSGIILGATEALNGLIRRTRNELGSKAPVILTGGGANFLSSGISVEHRIEPHLTLHGLRSIFELNGEEEMHKREQGE